MIIIISFYILWSIEKCKIIMWFVDLLIFSGVNLIVDVMWYIFIV